MTPNKIPPKIKELKYFFEYEKVSGILIWKNSTCRRKDFLIGKPAGRLDKSGYRQVAYKRRLYLTHRLVWFLFNKTWPEKIDHINGIKTDNRIENLREVTTRQNGQNQYKHRKGKLVGAHWYKKYQCWHSSIHVKGKSRHLGYFKTEMEAHQKYLEAVQFL